MPRGCPANRPSSPSNAPIRVRYRPLAALDTCLRDPDTLAVVRFEQDTGTQEEDGRVIRVGLGSLQPEAMVEVWSGPEAARTGRHGPVRYAHNREILIGQVVWDENCSPDLATAGGEAYRAILRCTQKKGFPHLIRMWNHFPNITGSAANALERYQTFCIGRHEAFARQPEFETLLPAATAIGTRTAGFLVYFIAARTPGVQVENPRQVSAFRYPPEYGPRSPSFSRAMYTRWHHDELLFVSGTASVRGHETRHSGNVERQTIETFGNLRALLAEAARLCRTRFHLDSHLKSMKVYVRDPREADSVRNVVRESLHDTKPVLFLQGDICRRGLRVEIEAVLGSEEV